MIIKSVFKKQPGLFQGAPLFSEQSWGELMFKQEEGAVPVFMGLATCMGQK